MFLFFHCKITVNEICLECRLCRLPMIIDAITANPWGFDCTKLAVNSCNLLILRTKRVIFNLGLWTNKACRSNIPRHFSSFDVPGFTWPQGVTSQKKKTTEKNNNNKKKNSSVPGNLHLHLKNTKNLHKLHQTLWVCMNMSKACAQEHGVWLLFQFCEVVDECLIGSSSPVPPSTLHALIPGKQGQSLLFHRLHYPRRLFHRLRHPRRLPSHLHALADSAVSETPVRPNAWLQPESLAFANVPRMHPGLGSRLFFVHSAGRQALVFLCKMFNSFVHVFFPKKIY